MLGIKHLRTTAYHPASNGVVERFHRQLKAAIKCHNSSNWVESLPIVLLGIRTAIKEDLSATAAEMIYSTGIRLPAEFFVPAKQPANAEFANRLRERMSEIRPLPTSQHGEKKTFMFRDVATSPYVFVRHDAIGGPLQPPYDGPYQVIQRGEKTFIIRVKDKSVKVSVDRLKPAFIVSEDIEHLERSAQALDVFVPRKIFRPQSSEQAQQSDGDHYTKSPLHHAFGQESSFSRPFSSGFELSG